VENIDAIEAFSAGMDLDAFAADRKTRYAVVRALEIISEASRRLPVELKDRRPEIDWIAVAAADNVYRHEYEGVDENLIWHTVRHDLGALRSVAAIRVGTRSGHAVTADSESARRMAG
jgi:uncharacterized protein with HEPN domain